MGSAYHRFAPPLGADEERCGHVGRDGEPCGRLAGSHLQDTRKRKDTRKGDRHKCRPPKAARPFVFFDTEGKGSKRKHRLIYGAAVSETGEVVLEVRGEGGKQPRPEVWLDALLEIGRRIKQRSIFAYGFGYDRTKMLEGLPPKVLYMLTRREQRPTYEFKKKTCVEPLYWGDYVLDLQGTRFSVAKQRRLPDGRPMKNAKGRRIYDRITVWDILKFFQCPFVDALDAWRFKGDKPKPENAESKLVVPDADLERMREMKAHRAEFDKMPWRKVTEYCQSECFFGANLVRELVTACGRIGISLRRFDGAGSISDALMQKYEVGQYMSAKSGDRVVHDSIERRRFLHAVMCAFAGGRFETSACGVERRRVWVKDITGAYPYAMYLHPCLACGKWEHLGDGKSSIRGIDKRIAAADLALLRVVCEGKGKEQAFGSFHHRDKDGNVTFPINNRTWTWKHEYLAARDAVGDRVRVLEAYLYTTPCTHQPFKFMGELYLERLRIGKEGRGIAMKLGYNGCAGKTMQRVGSHRWQEYVWAGNTTARTRSMLLEAMSRFPSQWDVAYVATDSVFAMRDVELAEPENTGTGEAMKLAGKPPLGGWEPGKAPYSGMCFVRPGIAFPLHATEEQLKEIKARGISKQVLLENVDAVVELMRSQEVVGGRGGELKLSRRIFGGMKMCTNKRGKPAEYVLSNDDEGGQSRYGCWYEQEIRIGIGARPKRFARLPGEEGMLLPWPDPPVSASAQKIELARGAESLAYGATKVSEEARALQDLQDMLAESPNLDVFDTGDLHE